MERRKTCRGSEHAERSEYGGPNWEAELDVDHHSSSEVSERNLMTCMEKHPLHHCSILALLRFP